MSTPILVPTLGESVTEATVAKWLKKAGEQVNEDEPIVELETDKVSVEVTSPKTGALSEITIKEGDTVEVGAKLGVIGEAGAAVQSEPEEKKELNIEKKVEAKKETLKEQPIKELKEEVKPEKVVQLNVEKKTRAVSSCKKSY